MVATSNTTKNKSSIPNWKISGDFFIQRCLLVV